MNNDGTPSTLSPDNPVALLNQRNNNSTVNRYILGAEIDYRLWFLEDLRVNLNLGYDHSDSEGTVYVPTNAAFNYSTGGIDQLYGQEIKMNCLKRILTITKKSAVILQWT